MKITRLLTILGTGLLLLSVTNLGVADQNKILRMATTTSTENSGLLKDIMPAFEKATGYQVRVTPVGTGKALRLGQDGDVDVVLVHAPPAEEKFVAAGYGVNRRHVMYNDFVIVGPANDPAKISGMKNAAKALATIAKDKAIFVSRGDDSGTNKKEKILWKDAGVKPSGKWYREAGQGMGKVLQMAGEMQGYTLTDRGTWLFMKDKLPLKIVVEGDPKLFNPYGVIAVNPGRYPDINYTGAMAFIAWITSPEGQALIGKYRVNNKQLFIPTALQVASGNKD
jgi:tungstate transport system substrate-binding protein